MYDFIDNWRSSELFKKQLNLNLTEISHESRYPFHWNEFIPFIKEINPSSILDVGCGCGVYYKLCKLHFPNIKYTGVDYSEEAISLAKETWKYDNFFTMDYKDLTKVYLENFDLLYLGGLLPVLPNADEALEYIISLDPKHVLISKITFTESSSFYSTYKAYDVTTYDFKHNKQNFLDLCSKNNYHARMWGSVENCQNAYLLKKE